MVPVELLTMLATGFAGALAVQTVAYVFALRARRVDVVDVAWGLSFVGIVVALHMYRTTGALSVMVVDALVAVWAFRLAWHIYARLIRSPRQDERYTQLMRRWPQSNRALQVLIRIFMVQALLATTISLPVIVVHVYEPVVSALTLLGALVWSVGFVVESVADWQLRSFLRTAPAGGLMQAGLWRYSRHPNYFGEITMWWGLALVAAATPLWALGFLGATTITLLIRFVSGVPLAEQRASSKPGWTAYKQRTSVLLPLPQKQR